MHSPFNVNEIIPASALGKDAITALLLHSNRVILGTDKGSLLVFDLSTASGSGTPPSATLVSKLDGFAKKAIDQLGVVKELNGLLCLAGGDITLHGFPTFSLLSSYATHTRSAASLFVLSTSIFTPPIPLSAKRSATLSRAALSPSPEVHSTLAIACRRKLLLFHWIDGAWIAPPTEVALPHQIRGMAFGETKSGGRRIVAGFSTGDYGVVTLPALGGLGQPQGKDKEKEVPTLGEPFTPTVPTPVASAAATAMATSLSASTGGASTNSLAKAAGTGLIGLGGLAKATGLGALATFSLGGTKLEKNGVVNVPKLVRKDKGVKKQTQGKEEDAWMWGKEWGWGEDGDEDSEVLIVRENIALPLSVGGRVRPASGSTTMQGVAYPLPVDETLVLSPYIISLLPPAPAPPSTNPPPLPTLSVHSIESLEPVQFLEIPHGNPSASSLSIANIVSPSSPTKDDSSSQTVTARFLTASSSAPQPPLILLTSKTGTGPGAGEQALSMVTMRSWESQIEELGQLGEWETGIKLARRSGAGGSELPPRLLKRLASLHSLVLFNSLRYDLAIDAFISLDLSPSKVVSLYPQPISGKLFLDPAAREEVFGGRAQHKVLQAMEDALFTTSTQSREDGDDGSGSGSGEGDASGSTSPAGKKEEEERKGHVSAVAAALKGSKSWLRDSTKAEHEAEEKAAQEQQKQAKLSAQNFSKSVDVLIRYLTDRRQKYAKALAAFPPSLRPLPTVRRPRASGAELLELPDLPLNELRPELLARVAQVVDTALFRSYLVAKPVMVGPLCRIENWCEVEEVEELLLTAKKYRELLDLYNGKNMHEKAVKLLKQMSEEEDDPEEKVGPTIRYLQKLGPDHVNLIFETSKWVFDANPAAALDIFIADLDEVESLPRHATMAHLERVSSNVCMTYLEHIIHQLGEDGPEFHEKLIELYLAAVYPKNKNPKAKECYDKLLDLLESSTSYRADRILGRLPSEDMHKVRAILLGRLGRHEGALQIYVYQLNDHATAEEYCRRVHEADPAMRSSIFHILLRIYLRPRPNHPMLFGPALALISAHASSIDAIEVFDLLPPLVALSDIKVFLEKTLRRSAERVREAKILKAIGKTLVEAEERTVVDLEERRVKITDSRVCPQCHKRLGNSVIAVHSPHGEVTHYNCREQYAASVNY